MILSTKLVSFYLINFLILITGFSQNIVKNGSFEFVDSCSIDENGIPFNRPLSWFSCYKNNSDFVVSSITSKEVCIPLSPIKPFDGNNCFQLGFKVNTSRVASNYIQTELIRPLIKDSVYLISLKIRKNIFSIGFINELQLLFSARKLSSSIQYTSPNLDRNLIKLNVDSINSKEWTLMNITYKATGFEHYLSVGSFHQPFNLKVGLKNYQAEKILYTTNTPNAIYFIDEIEINRIDSSFVQINKNQIERANLQNVFYRSTNLILNGGFEFSPLELDKEFEHYPEGVEIIDGWLSFGKSSASVYVVESNSNFYRYNRLNGNYPYMGKGVAEVSILKTNCHHQYQQVWSKQDGTDYLSIYKYENDPINKNIKKYKYGVYFTGILKEPLIQDSSYLFSMMSKLSTASSYGVKYIGIYFNQNVVKEFEDSLLKLKPDLLFDVSNLSRQSNWEEFSAFYKAKGDENHFTVGYYYSDDNSILKNYGFQRIISSSCGPNYSNGSYCLHYEATYRDSLFANYYFDNFLLRKIDGKEVLGAAIFDKSVINQTQWILDFGGTKTNTENLNKAKQILIESLNIMRIDDGIAITYINKANELKLTPTIYENKRKIIRLVDQYKINIKPGYTFFQDYTLLFDGSSTKGNNNHVVLVTEGSIHFENGFKSIENFCRNGGKLTILHTGNIESLMKLNEIFAPINNVLILSVQEENVLERFVRGL